MTIQPNGLKATQPEVKRGHAGDIAGNGHEALARVIEARVIPLISHARANNSQNGACSGVAIGDVDRLVDAVLEARSEASESYIKQQLDAGVSDEDICLKLLAPAAVRLGEGWLADELGFYDVTSGAIQLQSLLHMVDRARIRTVGGAGCGGRVVLCGAPGEQHLFGLSMLEFFFRRDGWETISTIGLSRDAVLDIVSTVPCDLVAYSCSCTGLLDGLASAIQLTRNESMNGDTRIMVGGQQFCGNPDLVNAVGSDSGARDALEATRVARALVYDGVPGGA